MNKEVFAQIHETLAAAQHIRIVLHQNPDGDTAGSGIALSHFCERRGYSFDVFCIDPLSEKLSASIPGSERIATDASVWETTPADVVVTVDGSSLDYLGVDTYIEALAEKPTIINIDHHKTNTQFGAIDCVDVAASSTCELMYQILTHAGEINDTIARCLMTGLLTDTGGFSNGATTPKALAIGAKIAEHHIDVSEMVRNTLQNFRLNEVKIWGRALERLWINKYGMAVTAVTQQDLEECNIDEDAFYGVANFLNGLDQTEATAVMVLLEKSDGTVKGSLRTTNSLIDVSKIATLFGGGGHQKAAGFSVTGRLAQTNNQWHVQQ